MQHDPNCARDAIRLAKEPVRPHEPPAPKERGVDFDGGLLVSAVHGRTDRLPINVLSGAYVLPADVVSGLGQGNTLGGAKMLDHVFSAAPKGAHSGERVPIIAAGGEYVVPPHAAEWLGDGDMKTGHERLDQFVKMVRAKNVHTTKNLPGPQK